MTLRIQDTLTNEKRDFEPVNPGKVGMYVCGVTPYDKSHLGHARVYVAFDAVYRYLQFIGYDVTYVRNFTDVDDKIIARANERGIQAVDLAQENIDAFYKDMDALGIRRPSHEPRVSTSIDDIIALIKRLEERGIAYAVDGDVYYAIDAFSEYGKLGKRSQDEMQAGARVEVNTKKKNPMDFALWKASKPGEPKWASPWGEGRPGWHIECSAMSSRYLGETFDIHGGGRDLVFPHHENEIAQSEGASGKPYVRYWMHNGFVTVDKEKMSKSLGNFFTVAEILERYEPLVVRHFMLATTHYRNPINFADAFLDESAARVAYFYETLRKVDAFLAEGLEPVGGPLPEDDLINSVVPRFREALDDDFNVARSFEVVAEIFKALNELVIAKKARRRPAATAAKALREELARIDEVLGLFGENPAEYLERHRAKAAKRRGIDLGEVERQVADRLSARQGRDFARADELRNALAAQGVVLMDHATGTDWMVADVVESKEEQLA